MFIHDAISYLTTEDDLRAAIETAFVHVRPGGVVILTPDATTEIFKPKTDHGGHDGDDGRSLRYLEWTHAPEPDASTYVTDYAIVARGPGDELRIVHDRHTLGLFPRGDLEAADRRGRPRARRHDRREPVRARAGRVRRTSSDDLTSSGKGLYPP